MSTENCRRTLFQFLGSFCLEFFAILSSQPVQPSSVQVGFEDLPLQQGFCLVFYILYLYCFHMGGWGGGSCKWDGISRWGGGGGREMLNEWGLFEDETEVCVRKHGRVYSAGSPVDTGEIALYKNYSLLLLLLLIFMDPLSEDDGENLEEDYSDSAEYSPELDKEVPNEVTDIRNEPVHSTLTFRLSSNQSRGTSWRVWPYSRQFCSSSLPLFKYYN